MEYWSLTQHQLCPWQQTGARRARRSPVPQRQGSPLLLVSTLIATKVVFTLLWGKRRCQDASFPVSCLRDLSVPSRSHHVHNLFPHHYPEEMWRAHGPPLCIYAH